MHYYSNQLTCLEAIELGIINQDKDKESSDPNINIFSDIEDLIQQKSSEIKMKD